MSDIKLSDEEAALFRETGSRGDAFREATQDRAGEQARTTGKLSEIVDGEGMLDAAFPKHTEAAKSMVDSAPAASAPAESVEPLDAEKKP